MKVCTRCKTIEVPQNKSWCPDCKRQYDAQYRKQNKKKLARLNKNWYANNIEYCKSVNKTYYNSEHGRITCLILSAKRRANKKQIPFEISEHFVNELLHKQNNKCALTQIEFDNSKNSADSMRPFAISIDRIDSSKGYTEDNIRLVCVAVNYALNEFGEAVFDKICKAYLNVQ